MKIICVGFWKTGTKSMSKALKMLGYKKIYDYEEQFLLLYDLWTKFFSGTVTDDDIHDALDAVDVLIDGPTIIFWDEIHRVFPNAKLIMTVRDEDGWWKSFKRMNDRMFEQPWLRFFTVLSPTVWRLGGYAQKTFAYAFGIEDLHLWKLSWNANERLYKRKYRMHNSHILQTVPSDSLLVHQSADGWEPLCKYLGKEVPSVSYPHQNKNASLFHEDAHSSLLFMKIKREVFLSISVLVLFLSVFLLWVFVG